MHAFTSVTANYLPKAAVLARTLKRTNPEVTFHLLISDDLPDDCPKAILESFDSIVTIWDLPLTNLDSWTFKHSVVELCTAVKGPMVEYLFDRVGAERVYYFDPDMVVVGSLAELNARLSQHAVVLTPHQTVPETSLQAIVDNEICSLAHGVYNLGFLGVRRTEEGLKFVRWWADRLRLFCHDDIPRGLFTDQRWVDLAPAFFDGIGVLRDPGYNVATWNLSTRRATGQSPWNIQINGRPLVFYHFSGLDSGAQLTMLERYGRESPVLFELRDWYLAECESYGQSLLGNRTSRWGCYDNGEPITHEQRVVYRNRLDLQQAFPNPYRTQPVSKSYFHWFAANHRKMILRRDKPEPAIRTMIRRHSHRPPLKWAKKAWHALRTSPPPTI
ncbi:hypothetical protein Isop_0016 [Isosphaera pallida ATCC 43644]|uniref:Glycosyl transferase n=1 Tax=Isosphaera pallida (strain ATCC 43644 / DSM 9630 / IS1B) TaxID=575540 RepID=E8R4M2_ISOPI|nr:hypothetical protein [Isosphaera pallida]ADV60613.1 hypothetical protein Isop_0016 [Isosphaera pallida ATCC 43644]